MSTTRLDYPRYPRDVMEKQIISLPASQRRLIDFHLTAFPSVLNGDKVKGVVDDLRQDDKGGRAHNRSPHVEMEKRAVALMTTNQLTASMTKLAQEEAQKAKTSEGTVSPTAYGVKARMYGASYDRGTTYRLDYCNKDVPGFHRRVREIPDYQKNWNEIDMENIKEANKSPFLTLPESILKNRQTMYRHDYIPQAEREDYRTLSHKTNLQDVNSSFAYSAYRTNDPARVVKYDSAIASCKNPRCLLWKTHSPRDSFVGKHNNWESIATELQKLRGFRRTQTSQSSKSSLSERKSTQISPEKADRIILPGMHGMGYRQAPQDNSDYIYLPRDIFYHKTVYDY